jgi:hypothetical protein
VTEEDENAMSVQNFGGLGSSRLGAECIASGRAVAASYAEQMASEADTNAQQDQVNQIEFESLE